MAKSKKTGSKSAGSSKSSNKKPAAPVVQAPVTEGMSVPAKVSWFALLALLFITPLAVSNFSWLGFQLPLTFDQFDIIKVFMQRVFTLIALAAWAWDMLLNGGKIRRTPVEWLILAFLAWATLSTVLSIHPPTAFFGKYRRFEGLLSFINYAVLYFLVLQYADRASRIRRIAMVLFWSGFIVALYGVMQSLGIEIMNWAKLPFEARRAFSTYGNPDLLGGFLMFSTFISIGLALAEKNLVWRGVYWAGFLLNGLCIVVAWTRSAWVGTAVGLIFIVLFAVRQKTPWKTEDWVFSGSTGIIVLAAIVQSFRNPNEVMNFAKRFQSIFVFGEGSAETRFQIWSAAIEATKDRPLFGFGPDTFRLIFPQYKPREYVADAGYLSVADNVHNYPLQLAAGIGIPGLLLLYSIFGWVAVRSWNIVFNREGGSDRMILAGFWTACAAYVTHLFFGLSVTGSTFILWIAMAVLMAPTAKSTPVKAPTWGAVAAIMVAVFALSGITYQFVIMAADRNYLKARVMYQGQQRTEAAQRAVELNPFNDIYRSEVGLAITDEVITLATQVSSLPEDQRQQGLNALQNAFQQGVTSFNNTIAFVPSEYDNYVFLTNLYTMGGQFINKEYYEDAIRVARRGIEVERYGPAIRYQLARPLAETGKIDEAIVQLEEAYDMDPNYTEAGVFLARLYLEQGEKDRAVEIIREIQTRKPDTPGLSDVLDLAGVPVTQTPTPTVPAP